MNSEKLSRLLGDVSNCQLRVDREILATPTSALRDNLTSANIHLLLAKAELEEVKQRIKEALNAKDG